MTSLQKISIGLVIRAAALGCWHRAGDPSPVHLKAHGSAAGERVTLASLYAAGVLVRRAWRGEDGGRNAAYEYRAVAEVVEMARMNGLLAILCPELAAKAS